MWQSVSTPAAEDFWTAETWQWSTSRPCCGVVDGEYGPSHAFARTSSEPVVAIAKYKPSHIKLPPQYPVFTNRYHVRSVEVAYGPICVIPIGNRVSVLTNDVCLGTVPGK